VKSLAREGRKLAAALGEKTTRVRDRSRFMGHKLRTIRPRSGEAKAEVLVLTEQTVQLLAQSSRRRGGWPRPPSARPGAAAPESSCGGLEALRACRSLREGRHADQAARRRPEDHRPVDLAIGPRCQADPQGQARQAQRVWLPRAVQRYRTGTQGRISHLNAATACAAAASKGDDGQKTTTGWGILAYNLETLTIRTA
jgi:hypothetical protein